MTAETTHERREGPYRSATLRGVAARRSHARYLATLAFALALTAATAFRARPTVLSRGQLPAAERPIVIVPTRPLRPLRDVTQLSTKGDHVCARLRDGSVRRWGRDAAAPVIGEVSVRSVATPTRADDRGCDWSDDSWRAPSEPSHGGAYIRWNRFVVSTVGEQRVEVHMEPASVGGASARGPSFSFASPIEELAVGGGAVCVRERTGDVRCHRFAQWSAGYELTSDDAPLLLARGAVGMSMSGSAACAWSDRELHCAQVGENLLSAWAHDRRPRSSWRLPHVARAWPGPAADAMCASTRDGAVWCAAPAYTHGVEPLHEVPALRGAVHLGWRGAGDGSTRPGAIKGGCALTPDTRVVCWGANLWLGDGATVRTATPSRARGLPAATSLTAGNEHACALTAGRELWCWGYGRAFQGTTRASGTPTLAAVDVARVHTRETCTNALLEDGRVMGWDVNSAMFFAGSYHALEAVKRMPYPLLGLEVVQAALDVAGRGRARPRPPSVAGVETAPSRWASPPRASRVARTSLSP
jgi:hypothetical protein